MHLSHSHAEALVEKFTQAVVALSNRMKTACLILILGFAHASKLTSVVGSITCALQMTCEWTGLRSAGHDRPLLDLCGLLPLLTVLGACTRKLSGSGLLTAPQIARHLHSWASRVPDHLTLSRWQGTWPRPCDSTIPKPQGAQACVRL